LHLPECRLQLALTRMPPISLIVFQGPLYNFIGCVSIGQTTFYKDKVNLNEPDIAGA